MNEFCLEISEEHKRKKAGIPVEKASGVELKDPHVLEDHLKMLYTAMLSTKRRCTTR